MQHYLMAVILYRPVDLRINCIHRPIFSVWQRNAIKDAGAAV